MAQQSNPIFPGYTPPSHKQKQRYVIEGGWKREYVGKNIYKIYPDPSPSSVTMTGSDVTKQLNIGFSHRLLRISFYHTGSAYAASYDNLLIRIERTAGTMTPVYFEEYLYEEDLIIHARITLIFGETYEYEPSIWKFTFNTTSGDLIFPVIYIQKIEQRGG